MSKGNDATPTWSGFNYQGKIMILHVLKLINEIQKNADKGIYSVEIEKTYRYTKTLIKKAVKKYAEI